MTLNNCGDIKSGKPCEKVIEIYGSQTTEFQPIPLPKRKMTRSTRDMVRKLAKNMVENPPKKVQEQMMKKAGLDADAREGHDRNVLPTKKQISDQGKKWRRGDPGKTNIGNMIMMVTADENKFGDKSSAGHKVPGHVYLCKPCDKDNQNTMEFDAAVHLPAVPRDSAEAQSRVEGYILQNAPNLFCLIGGTQASLVELEKTGPSNGGTLDGCRNFTEFGFIEVALMSFTDNGVGNPGLFQMVNKECTMSALILMYVTVRLMRCKSHGNGCECKWEVRDLPRNGYWWHRVHTAPLPLNTFQFKFLIVDRFVLKLLQLLPRLF